MFYLVGLGLSDAEDVTVKGLEIIRRARRVYLEAYTSVLTVGKVKLEEFYGREVVLADREMVEQESDAIFEDADKEDIAFLVVGDPFGATTHTDLVLRAKQKQVDFKIVHNASIMNAVGCCGLQLYNFGETVSIVFWTETWQPHSFYDKIALNRKRGLHTLCLLDIKMKEQTIENLIKGRKIFEPPRFMTVSQAADQLLSVIKSKRQETQTDTVLFEHKSRVEKSLRQEKNDHKKTREEMAIANENVKAKYSKERNEHVNKINLLQQQHKMLQSQHTDMESEYSKLQASLQKLKEDIKLEETNRNQEFMQLKQEKELEISSLKDKVANQQRENSQLKQEIETLKLQSQQQFANHQIGFHQQRQQPEMNQKLQANILPQNEILGNIVKQDVDSQQVHHQISQDQQNVNRMNQKLGVVNQRLHLDALGNQYQRKEEIPQPDRFQIQPAQPVEEIQGDNHGLELQRREVEARKKQESENDDHHQVQPPDGNIKRIDDGGINKVNPLEIYPNQHLNERVHSNNSQAVGKHINGDNIGEEEENVDMAANGALQANEIVQPVPEKNGLQADHQQQVEVPKMNVLPVDEKEDQMPHPKDFLGPDRAAKNRNDNNIVQVEGDENNNREEDYKENYEEDEEDEQEYA